ncbi:uncharacterized protein LOC131054690 [Cryptomeria japonica]|uniref:uncharacterized protein LOC131054690 n=1 Tax=Cryptomeria japonica TaxID=3369 RepID=UPI0027DA27EA|nr:uncharacterized protein LOC131054690 [Cryptomeria japonica]
MEKSRKRSRDFRIDNDFTAEEMEAVDALLRLCHLGCFYVHWAVKRRRSAIARDVFNDTQIKHQFTLPNKNPLTALGLWAGGLRPSSKDMAVKHVSRRRLPKKKTHKELKEMVNTLLSEKSRLKKEEEQLMKTYQELKKWHYHLKSKLAARLDQRQEQKLLSTPQPTSSDRGSSHGTKNFVSLDDSFDQRQEQKLLSTPQATSSDRGSSHGTKNFVSLDDSFDHFVGTVGLELNDEPLHVGVFVFT